MKITEKQLLVLIKVLEGSLQIYDRKDLCLFGYTRKVRKDLYDELINQQNGVVETKSLNLNDLSYCPSKNMTTKLKANK